MSKFKKGLFLILLVGCIFSLAACDYSYYLYHNTDGNNPFLNKGVVSIELIKYENPAAQNDPLENYDFDLNKVEILETLNIDSLENFVNELIKIGGLSGKAKQVLKSPVGMGIRINYDDNSFTLITVTVVNGKDCVFLGEYDVNSALSMTFGISWQNMIDDFRTLANKYFTIQI